MGQLNFSPAAKPLWVCLKSPDLSNVNDSLKGHGKWRIKVDILENSGENFRGIKKKQLLDFHKMHIKFRFIVVYANTVHRMKLNCDL